jgi:predicted Zn-dependent peptidase
VAASCYRRLEDNMSLLIQLAFYEALLNWQEINETPVRYEAVTAAEIKRVANSYFDESNRSVAIYRRGGEQPAGEEAVK